MVADFNMRVQVHMTKATARACSHPGECLYDVQAALYAGTARVTGTAADIRAELAEYGAWSDDELADDAKNLERIVWIAAGDIMEGARC